MDYMKSQACIERFELEKERIQDRPLISRGKLLPLTNQLRESLANVHQEVQKALEDGAVLINDDIGMLCADEAKKANGEEGRESYAHTIFFYSHPWLSVTPTCH